jgi:hypothetical protein
VVWVGLAFMLCLTVRASGEESLEVFATPVTAWGGLEVFKGGGFVGLNGFDGFEVVAV